MMEFNCPHCGTPIKATIGLIIDTHGGAKAKMPRDIYKFNLAGQRIGFKEPEGPDIPLLPENCKICGDYPCKTGCEGPDDIPQGPDIPLSDLPTFEAKRPPEPDKQPDFGHYKLGTWYPGRLDP